MVIILLMVELSEIKVGGFDNSQLDSMVIVLPRVWLSDVELGRFDDSFAQDLVE